MPVSAAAFNNINGSNILAYAVSYDWAHGHKGNFSGHPNKIMLHELKVGAPDNEKKLRTTLNDSLLAG